MRRLGIVMVSVVALIGAVGVVLPSGASAATGDPVVSAGDFNTCGLKTDGTVVCWGANFDGQSTAPGGTFTQISSGAFHGCGIESDATVTCWGANTSGQAPAVVGGTYTDLGAGTFHTCGVQTGGAASCWGDDFAGQSAPPAGSFAQVSSGFFHTCGLRTDSTVTCWGADASGQAPATVAGTFSQISAGDAHNCGVQTDNTVTCWGYNFDGAAPPTVPGSFTAVSAGGSHTCGLHTDQTVTCWGLNDEGQAPPSVSGTFTQVSAGGFHTCAVRTDNVVVCWGRNDDGQAPASPPNLVAPVAIATMTTLASSVNPSTIGQSVTLTATVAAASGTDSPTGAVQFKDGAVNIGGPQPVTAGATPGVSIATITTSFAVGSRSITAVFVATGTFANSASAPVTQHVGYMVTNRSGKSDMQKKVGSKLDIKLELGDASGFNLSSPGLDATAQCVIPDAAVDCTDPAAVPINALFTLHTTGKAYYSYELQNPGLAGGDYALVVSATGDPVQHRVPFGVKG